MSRGTDRTANGRSDETSPGRTTGQRYTVAEAARALGISAEAVRSRVRRGTLRSEEDGETVYVLLRPDRTGDRTRPGVDRTPPGHDPASDRAELVEALREQVEDLRSRLDREQEANRENRRIIAGLVQRVPELEGPRDGRETAAAEPEGSEPRPATEGAQETAERRSWLHRFFFGE